MFGSKPAFGAPSFGAATTSFGNTTFGGQQQQSTSLFGAAKPTVSFGQPSTGGGLFGGTTTTASSTFGGAGTSLFGTSSTSGTTFGAPSGSFFGAPAAGTSSGFQTGPASTGFGFGGTTGGSLFSSMNTQTTQQPVASSTSLFGNNMSSLSSNMFGATATQTSGSVIKFNPLIATDQMMKNNAQTTVSTRHQCISAMKEYENKSLEELRVEDYLANRKGPQQQPGLTFGQPQQQPQTSVGLFGAPAATTAQSTSLFGATKAFGATSAFGAPTFPTSTGSAFGGGGSSLFATQPSIFGGNKAAVSFGQPAAQQPTGGFFGSQTTTSTAPNIFGGTAAGSFGTAPTVSAFGTTAPATNLFGQPAGQSIFGATTATPFQTGTSAPSSTGFGFGQPTNLFPTTATQQPAASIGMFGSTMGAGTTNLFGGSTSQPSSTYTFGSTLPSNQIQQQKPTFGSALSQPFGGGSFFGSNTTNFGNTGMNLLNSQAKQPTYNNLTSFGSGLSNFGSSVLSNIPPQNVTIGTDQATFAAQQALMQSQLLGIAQSPYGDSALLKLLKGKRDDSLPSPTDPVSQRHVLNAMNCTISPLSSTLNSKPLPPARPSPRVLTMTNGGINTLNISKDKKSLFDDFESDTIVFKEGFVPKRNIKKLVLNRSLSKNEKQRTSSSADNSQRSILSDSLAITTAVKRSSLPLNDKIAKPLNFNVTSTNGEDEDNVSYLDASPELNNIGRRESAAEKQTFIVTDGSHALVRPLSRPPISHEKANRSPTEKDDDQPTSVDEYETYTVLSRTKEILHSTSYENNNRANLSVSSPSVISHKNMTVDDPSMSLDDGIDHAVGDISRHPAGIVCQREDYYTVPSLDELSERVDDDGRCIVDGFTVGRKEFGSIFWPETINVANLNLDQLVHFRHKEVTVYPEDEKKPAVGFGLNRKAEITLERVWPNDKTTHVPIKDPKRLEMMRYRERLDRASTQMNAKFLAYRPETGSWVFQVPHFSKYGLGDDDADEDDEPLKAVHVDRKIFRRAPVISPSPLEILNTNASIANAAVRTTVAQITQPKNILKLTTYNDSLLCGRHRLFLDSSCFNNRRFRIAFTNLRKYTGKGFVEEKDGLRVSVFRTVGRSEANFSRDFTLHIQQPTRDQEFSSELVETLLSTQLRHSTRVDRPGCPYFVPSNGVELTSLYVEALSGENFGDENIFVNRVFELCEVLWGQLKPDSESQYMFDMARKAKLTEWLSEVSREAVNAEVKEAKSKGKEHIIDAVYSLLTSRQLEDAAQTAFDNGDVRLSVLLTQLCGSEQTKALFRQQLVQWFECQADQFIDVTRMKIFCLLAGVFQHKTSSKVNINCCDRLDWIRCIGMNIWYHCHPCCTIGDALEKYDSSWMNEDDQKNFASPPIPIYVNCNEKSKDLRRPIKEDICYNLIKLFSDRTHSLETVLNNETWTSDPLSYYLSWHLWCVLNALGFANLSDQSKNKLILHYSAQLEQNDLWSWSLFVLLHIEDDHCREKAIKRILSLYAPSASDDHMNFIRNELFIPESWIFEAKALKARSDGNKRDETWYQMKSGNWNLAHRLFLENAGPSLVVNEDNETLRLFLSEFSRHADEIQNWSNGGQLFYDYVLLKTKYIQIKNIENALVSELNSLKPSVISLATRLKALNCSTPLQRLCQSEMAFFIAQLMRIVLSDDKYLDLSYVVANLPMPDDYLLEELQHMADITLKKSFCENLKNCFD